MTAAILLLAAGNSARMGAPKQLLNFGGKPLVRHTAEIALAAQCGPVVVVLGAYEPEVRDALKGLDVEMALNPRWPEGMGTSIQAGFASAAASNADAVILQLSDQPRVSSAFLKQLVEQHRQSARPIVAARYAQTAGVPALFARSTFPLLLALSPDQGCKKVILSHPDDALLIDCPEAEIDIDTPKDYARVIAEGASHE
jgi:molybdenum cofactor cytidylyltransferase